MATNDPDPRKIRVALASAALRECERQMLEAESALREHAGAYEGALKTCREHEVLEKRCSAARVLLDAAGAALHDAMMEVRESCPPSA